MTSVLSPFRPLEVELGSVLGWNDGTSLNVVEHDKNDGMVFYHERIHGTLIHATIDGAVLKLIQNAGPRLPDAQHSAELARAVTYLFEGSRFAHEAAATYLGIMLLDTEDERRTSRQRLPDQYGEYYDFMSGLVDPHCQSSFLRFLVGQSIAFFWFSSNALVEFAQADYRGEAITREEFCANWRARSSASWLAKVGVQAALSAAARAALGDSTLCDKIGVSNLEGLEDAWQDDAWWTSLARTTAGFLEELISRITFAYFLDNSDLRSATRELIDPVQSEFLFLPLYERAHIQLISVSDEHRHSPDAEISHAAALREFMVVGRTLSHVRSHVGVSSVHANSTLGMGDLDAFVSRENLVDIMLPEFETSEDARICTYSFDPSDSAPSRWKLSTVFRCRSQLAIELLRRIMRRRIAGETAPHIDCVVAQAKYEDAYRVHECLLAELDHPAANGTSLTSSYTASQGKELLQIYVRDDWTHVAGTFEDRRPPTSVGTIDVNIAGREPFQVNVARVDGLVCNLVKAYPRPAAPALLAYYASCFQRGDLIPLERQPGSAEFLQAARRAFIAFSLIWPTL
ncbi:hypothetical protein [Paracidovorax avenae]|uniref:hypothetical protein n=1 Tax=Paracidovorax avenae TaxID=80867 RepID=UPI0018649A49|nr:hypothetical protein [Paracidovorax avenae]